MRGSGWMVDSLDVSNELEVGIIYFCGEGFGLCGR